MGVTAEVMLEYENLDSITQIVTICPQAFTTQKYKDQLVQGSDVVVGEKMKDFQPKSLTLLHECFHVVWNVEMLSGKNEKCRLFFVHPPFFNQAQPHSPRPRLTFFPSFLGRLGCLAFLLTNVPICLPCPLVSPSM